VIRWVETAQIKAPVGAWSKPRSVPTGLFKIVPEKGEIVQVLLLKDGKPRGKPFLLDSFEQVDIGDIDGDFQLSSSTGREVTVFQYEVK
jgi:hypothetical protein